MNADVFAAWMNRQGRHIIRTHSSYWSEVGPRVYQAFPFNWVIQPSEEELRNMMQKYGILTLRYSAPLTSREGMISYHTILNGPYTLEGLSSKARTAVRAGLKNFTIEPITFERLADEGWRLQRATLERQGRLSSMSQAEWERMCLGAKDLPGFEAWAALYRGELAATDVAARVDDKYLLLYEQSDSQYLSRHVNNALVFTLCQNLLQREGVKEIFLGLHSLDAPSSVDAFKFQLGVKPRPVRQRVVFNPLAAPLVNATSHNLLRQLNRWVPGSNVFSKAEGMFRFYLEGKRPLLQQDWPSSLEDLKKYCVRTDDAGRVVVDTTLPQFSPYEP